jgi:hypothetical protein
MTLPVHVVTEVKNVSNSAEKQRVELAKDAPSLKDLIETKVRAEIDEWRARGRRTFGREYATELDLRAQAAPASIEQFKNWKAPAVDEAKEVAKALRAFELDKFHVYFGDRRIRDLAERVPGDRPVRFIRQTPLPKL